MVNTTATRNKRKKDYFDNGHNRQTELHKRITNNELFNDYRLEFACRISYFSLSLIPVLFFLSFSFSLFLSDINTQKFIISLHRLFPTSLSLVLSLSFFLPLAPHLLFNEYTYNVYSLASFSIIVLGMFYLGINTLLFTVCVPRLKENRFVRPTNIEKFEYIIR